MALLCHIRTKGSESSTLACSAMLGCLNEAHLPTPTLPHYPSHKPVHGWGTFEAGVAGYRNVPSGSIPLTSTPTARLFLPSSFLPPTAFPVLNFSGLR